MDSGVQELLALVCSGLGEQALRAPADGRGTPPALPCGHMVVDVDLDFPLAYHVTLRKSLNLCEP